MSLRKTNRKSAEKLKARIKKLERHCSNIYQDHCENAYVEVSCYDALKQALFKIDPKHPALRGEPPNFGVWEAQRKEIERLEEMIQFIADDRELPHDGKAGFIWRLQNTAKNWNTRSK